MNGEQPRPDLRALVPVPTYRDRPSTQVADVAGTDLSGLPLDYKMLGSGRLTLLLFLSSGCQGCLELWRALGEPDSALRGEVPVVVVTRDRRDEDTDELSRLAPAHVPVIASSRAWVDYRVQGPPFFVLADGRSEVVVTEGVAWGSSQVVGHVRRALTGSVAPEVGRLNPVPEVGVEKDGH